MVNAVDLLKVGEVFRVTADPRNKGRGVWFSHEVHWRKIDMYKVEAVSLGSSEVGHFSPTPVEKYVSEFNDVDIVVLEGSDESRHAAAAAMYDPFDQHRAECGHPVYCWIPDRVNKNHGQFEIVYYVGRTRRGLVAIEYAAPAALAAVDPGMLRMAPQPVPK